MSNFDRVRPRSPKPTGTTSAGVGSHDPEGKRALFSATSPGADQPGVGSVSVECSSCGERSVMSPIKAIRASLTSVHLGFGFSHRDRTTTIGVTTRDYPSWMKCPACQRRTWVRMKLIV